MAYIDKNIACDLLAKKALEEQQVDECAELTTQECLSIVRAIPTADVEEVKHGYWKHSVEFGFAAKYHFWNCSVCGVASEDEGKEKYCRECGAKMDGGK